MYSSPPHGSCGVPLLPSSAVGSLQRDSLACGCVQTCLLSFISVSLLKNRTHGEDPSFNFFNSAFITLAIPSWPSQASSAFRSFSSNASSESSSLSFSSSEDKGSNEASTWVPTLEASVGASLAATASSRLTDPTAKSRRPLCRHIFPSVALSNATLSVEMPAWQRSSPKRKTYAPPQAKGGSELTRQFPLWLGALRPPMPPLSQCVSELAEGRGTRNAEKRGKF